MDLPGLKAALLRLLKEDEEFRYAVAGLIGLEEVLRRLDRHGEELVKLREEVLRVREDMLRVVEWLKRHDELFGEVFRRLDRHEEELVRLRADMARGFELVQRRLDALGARWGVLAEEAFREGLRGLLERELGLRVEKWQAYDGEGRVFGYPSEVDVDVTVEDGKVTLVEVVSHARASDVYVFKRKAELYAEREGRRPDRLVMVTPYAEEKAVEAALRLGVELSQDYGGRPLRVGG